MSNHAPTKPHLGPKFCPSYIPEDYQVAIIHIFEESKSISFRKILVILGNFGEFGKVPWYFSNLSKIKLSKIP